MAEFLVAGLAWGALKLTSSIVSAGFKKLASAGVNRLIGGEEEDAAMVEWSGDIVLKAREKAAGVTTRPTQMAPASRAVEGLQQEVRGGMATLSRDLHSGLGTMGAAAAAEIAGVRSEVRGVKRDLAVVRASVEECRAENMEFFESFTANLESAQESIAIMRSAPLHEADMALKNFEASRGNVRFLETAHSKAMTALVQGHTLDVKLSAGIIAIAAGYVYMSKTDSPSDAKYFTVNGTLSNIVQHFAPIWADPSVAGTPDGKKTLSFLLNLVSCVCVLPADDVPVLPRLDKRLLPAFGALCAAEPELRRLYPAVAGAAVRAMLESKSMKGLFQLADEIDVDAEDCTSKDAVVQALLTSGKSLVPMVPAVSAPVRDAGTDRAALMAFHKATGGPSWESKRGWGTSARLCDWYGVKVDFEGRVVELKLCDNSLAGSIPRELGGLSKLKKLWLSKNKLNGTIPPELGNLAALTDLNLFGNHLSGPIPPELGNLASLRSLELHYNELSGTIPKELGKLIALRKLFLYSNNLSGPIPPELGALRELKTLELNSNQLTGTIPKELGKLIALRKLFLYSNNLSGPIPAALGALSELEKLWLGNNKLTGPIPPELGKLAALKDLRLGRNQLTGPIPKELGDLTELKLLDLGRNELSGAIPKELGALSKLEELALSNNKLTVFPRAVAESFAARDVQVTTLENRWTEPPADVLEVGMEYAARFLKDLEDFGRTSSNRLKVVLVGLGNAGKTSVAVRLEGLASSKSLPTADERTVGVEIRDIQLGPGPADGGSRRDAKLDVKLWDFAGQRAYYDTHQIFLTPGALFVLVVDIFAYSEDGSSREDALEQWLDILQSRVPGSVVLLVGTHSDSFDSPAECSKRVECFLKDKEYTMERIGRECKSARECARQDSAGNGDREHAGVQDSRRYQPLRVVVVNELLALNLTPSGGVTTAQLQEHIEGVAYGMHDGYSFPSVNSEVPEPHLLAVATLEAVRRGATLRETGGEPAKVVRRLYGEKLDEGQPFVLFPEALSRFLEIAGEKSMFGGNATDGERVFVTAIELHEAQGAILLTRVDGGGEKEDMQPASEEHLVIHVNPAWFADLIRRIVDVRLLDPAQQEKVAGMFKRQPASAEELSKQHRRFFLAGEVSRRYMKFLWKDRDLELGPASPNPAAPPFEMSEEIITTMVESLLAVRFMFRVRDKEGGVVPDRYIVASCLPDHVGCAVDPKKLLGLKVGGAIFSRKLELVGAHSVPPGLIPRLLAWCGQGDARITACWKRGVCFAFNRKHLVLLYEHREAGRSVIECHAMGNAHDEEAGGTLEDVVTELGRLVRDAKYGFPGVGLFFDGDSKKEIASSDDELEVLFALFAGELKDHMNVKFEELERKSDVIAGGVEGHLRKGQEEMANSFNHQIQQLGQDISRKLDCIAAITSKCLLVSVEKDIPCPRLIMVSEDVSPGSAPSSLSHFRREMVDKLLRREGPAPRCYRIRFLCAYNLTAATCGEDGLGYKVEIQGWQKWLKACLPVFKVSLWLLRVGISVVTRADILPVDGVMEILEEVAGGEAAGILGEIDLQGQRPSGQDLVDKVNDQEQVFGTAYAELAKWVQQKENEIGDGGGDAQTPGNAVGGGAVDGGQGCGWLCSWWRRSHNNTPAPTGTGGGTASGGCAMPGNVTGAVPAAPVAPVSTVAPAGELSFERDMVLASRQRGTEAPEWAWVRRVNKDKWQKFQSPSPATTAVSP